jgi:hypothetical protein
MRCKTLNANRGFPQATRLGSLCQHLQHQIGLVEVLKDAQPRPFPQ